MERFLLIIRLGWPEASLDIVMRSHKGRPSRHQKILQIYGDPSAWPDTKARHFEGLLRSKRKLSVALRHGNWNPLPLILKCRIIEHPMCVEEKVEIVKADDRFLLGRGAEAILVDEHIDVLAHPRRQRGASQARKNQHLTFLMSLLSRGSKSRSALSRACILRTRQ